MLDAKIMMQKLQKNIILSSFAGFKPTVRADSENDIDRIK